MPTSPKNDYCEYDFSMWAEDMAADADYTTDNGKATDVATWAEDKSATDTDAHADTATEDDSLEPPRKRAFMAWTACRDCRSKWARADARQCTPNAWHV